MSPEQRPAFQQQQLAFTAHIRDPRNAPAPEGIPPERMSVYNALFFNGIDSHLTANFPVLREITPDQRWERMIRDFFGRHRCSTPLFTGIGLEFLEYLQHEREPEEGDWPFMLELAHYEYAELAVAVSDADRDVAGFSPNGDLLHGCPVLAPTAWNLSYQYPVHRISPDFLPDAPSAEATHLVVYRDRQDEVHFLEINPVTQRLLILLKENPQRSGLETMKQIAEELQHPQPNAVITHGQQLLQELHQRNIILGSR